MSRRRATSTASPGPGWVMIRASEIRQGDRVSVLGITNTRSAILTVDELEQHRDRTVVRGGQPWGRGTRQIERTLHPEGPAWRWQT